ncbi:MAG: gliding motility lipoprotein GldH [Tannerellaceae bacterium]|nr:gliding motility lipoprotein GldH [Tannerellaceae bacterium]
MNRKKILVFYFICLCSFSCDDQLVYNQFHQIDRGLWENEIVFSVEVEDISRPYNLTIEIRNSNLYPFQDLWIACLEERPDSSSRQDTLSLRLADPYGRWLGSGISLFETEYSLHRGYYFPQAGTYTHSFYHLMEKFPLPGIQEVGLRLDKGK